MRRASSEFILVSLCIQWLLPSEDSNTLVSSFWSRCVFNGFCQVRIRNSGEYSLCRWPEVCASAAS